MTHEEQLELITKKMIAIPDTPANDADFNKYLEVALAATGMLNIPPKVSDLLQDTAATGWKFGAMYGAKTTLNIMLDMMRAEMANRKDKEGDK